MIKLDVEHTVIDVLSCQLSIIGVHIEVKDGIVSRAQVTGTTRKENYIVNIGGEVQLVQLGNAIENVLNELTSLRQGAAPKK